MSNGVTKLQVKIGGLACSFCAGLAAGFTAVAASMMVTMWLGYPRPWFPWVMLGLAPATVFGPGGYILKMAV